MGVSELKLWSSFLTCPSPFATVCEADIPVLERPLSRFFFEIRKKPKGHVSLWLFLFLEGLL